MPTNDWCAIYNLACFLEVKKHIQNEKSAFSQNFAKYFNLLSRHKCHEISKNFADIYEIIAIVKFAYNFDLKIASIFHNGKYVPDIKIF